MNGPRCVTVFLLISSLPLSPSSGTSPALLPSAATVPAVPIEPITAILDAFRTHSIVALGEGPHGNEQGAAFRLALMRDPRFADVVNDILVECGNARYHDTIDRRR